MEEEPLRIRFDTVDGFMKTHNKISYFSII